jgi:hypothetical protein
MGYGFQGQGHFGISRKTAYKWLGRYADGPIDSLRDRSCRPHHSPRSSPSEIEQAVLAIRTAHPAWGGRKIVHVLARDQERRGAPRTVTSILRRHDLIDPGASAAATAWQRFEHESPQCPLANGLQGPFCNWQRTLPSLDRPQ